MCYVRRGGGACGLCGVLKAAEDELGALVLRRNDGDEHDDGHRRDQLVRPRERHEAGDAVRGHHVDEAVQDQAHCRRAQQSNPLHKAMQHPSAMPTLAICLRRTVQDTCCSAALPALIHGFSLAIPQSLLIDACTRLPCAHVEAIPSGVVFGEPPCWCLFRRSSRADAKAAAGPAGRLTSIAEEELFLRKDVPIVDDPHSRDVIGQGGVHRRSQRHLAQ